MKKVSLFLFLALFLILSKKTFGQVGEYLEDNLELSALDICERVLILANFRSIAPNRLSGNSEKVIILFSKDSLWHISSYVSNLVLSNRDTGVEYNIKPLCIAIDLKFESSVIEKYYQSSIEELALSSRISHTSHSGYLYFANYENDVKQNEGVVSEGWNGDANAFYPKGNKGVWYLYSLCSNVCF